MSVATIEVSVVIVNYNTRDLLEACLTSIYRNQTGTTVEVIIVDNNSSDGSVPMVQSYFKSVRVIVNNENLGFAAACNLGIRIARGKYILLLNSDTEILSDTLFLLQRFLDTIHPDLKIGIIGCKICNSDGTLQYSAGKFPSILSTIVDMFKPRHKRKYNLNGYDESHEVDWITGAFMVIDRRLIHDVGLMDERYFMYYEEVDYCLKAKSMGWKVFYWPSVSIIHKNPHAYKQHEVSEKVMTEIRRSHLYYFRKNHNYFSFLFLSFATLTFLLVKFCYFQTVSYFKKEPRRSQRKEIGTVLVAVWNAFWELNKKIVLV
jgi:GT2 family glycosyltransferase